MDFIEAVGWKMIDGGSDGYVGGKVNVTRSETKEVLLRFEWSRSEGVSGIEHFGCFGSSEITGWRTRITCREMEYAVCRNGARCTHL